MDFIFTPPPQAKRALWIRPKQLLDRLVWLLASCGAGDLEVCTTELSGNASFVNYVRLHKITHVPSGAVLEVIEKSIRKIIGITSMESRFYHEGDLLTNSLHFQHPRCYGIIETPAESLIFTQYIQGRAPRMHAIATQIAEGISELESLTYRHLQTATVHQRGIRLWQMDFFRPWYLLRPRFNFQRCFSHLRALATQNKQFDGLEFGIRGFVSELSSEARFARNSPRCICHLDYLRKNLFASRKGLYLIDWSEVKVGRIGFDAGAYLSALFRRNEMPLYEKARDEFLKAYTEALDPKFDKDMALRNARYLFLLNSLWNCMREETIQEYREAGRLPLLKQKLEYLLSLKAQ
jgi:hypothetical protein